MTRPECRVLALYPTTRGFGFAFFDRSERLIDWGITGIRSPEKNDLTLKAIVRLIERLDPAVITYEDARSRCSRRHGRICQLLEEIDATARKNNLQVFRFERSTVQHYFGIRTKHELAEMIASAYPAIAPRLPPRRKAWMSEDARQSLFDAVALGLVCLAAIESGPGGTPHLPS